MKALAGTGFPRHKQFVQAARGYRDGYIRFIREWDAADPSSAHVWYIKEGLSKKPVRSDEVPHFEGAADVSVAVRTALFDTSLLITLAVVCFMMSYVAFLRSWINKWPNRVDTKSSPCVSRIIRRYPCF